MGLGQVYSKLPPLARGIIAVATVGVTGIIIYKTFKFIQAKLANKDNNKAVNEAGDEYKRLEKQDSLSFPEANYYSTANTIQKLLDGCEMPDTEVQVVSEIVKLIKKPIDWYFLIKAWGIRKIDDCGVLTGSTDYDLTTLLKDQLDSAVSANAIKIDGKRIGGLSDDFKDTAEFLSDYLKSIEINF